VPKSRAVFHRFLIAFDTKRNQVVVLASRPDAEDGPASIRWNGIPHGQPAQLTQTVPVSSLRTGKKLPGAHLTEARRDLSLNLNGELVDPLAGVCSRRFQGQT